MKKAKQTQTKPYIWAGYDKIAARKAWRESAGVLHGVEVETLLADLKANRE